VGKKIIKFCKDEHNICKSGTTVQLGTLQYYQTNIDPNIKDSYEGKLKDVICYDELRVHSTELLNELGTSARFSGGGKVIFKNMVINTEIKNALIFCVSEFDESEVITADLGKQISSEYNSFYEIKDIQGFLSQVGKLLLEMRVEKVHDNEGIKIFGRAGSVGYVDEKEKRFDCVENAILSRKNRTMFDPIFLKLKKSQDNFDVDFTKNREFRFSWILFDKFGKEFNLNKLVQNDLVRIDASSLRKFCK
jgi:hypothetical protein